MQKSIDALKENWLIKNSSEAKRSHFLPVNTDLETGFNLPKKTLSPCPLMLSKNAAVLSLRLGPQPSLIGSLQRKK